MENEENKKQQENEMPGMEEQAENPQVTGTEGLDNTAAEESSVEEPITEMKSNLPEETGEVREQLTEEHPEDTAEDQEPQEKTEEKVEKSAKPMPTWLRNTLIALGFALILFAAGFIVAMVTQTAPTRQVLQSTRDELNSAQQALLDTQTNLEQTQQELSDTQALLTSTQNDLESSQAAYTNLNQTLTFMENLQAIKYNVALSRIALLKEDKLSASQTLSLASDSFDLIKDQLDSQSADVIAERLSNAIRLSRSNIQSALEELRTLTENLERIPVE